MTIQQAAALIVSLSDARRTALDASIPLAVGAQGSPADRQAVFAWCQAHIATDSAGDVTTRPRPEDRLREAII